VKHRLARSAWIACAAVCATALAAAAASAAPGPGHVLPTVVGPSIASLHPAARASTAPCPVGDAEDVCWSPYQLEQAYDIPAQLDGRGQTILIVDPYGSPTLTADLSSFDSYYGIPAPPSLQVVNAPASPQSTGGSGDTFDWSVETSLDVQYAHAIAPGAKIVVDVAASDDNADLVAAAEYAFPRFRGAIVTQSFGDFETDPTAGSTFQQLHRLYALATALGDTIVASAGDDGAAWADYTGDPTQALAGYPASDPLVTGVGGTMGNPYPGGLYDPGTNGYGGEQVWNEDGFGATGGAPSKLFAAPYYQLGLTGYRTRTVPDVALDAAGNGGVAVWVSPNVYGIGGASMSAPMWAGIVALADQARQQTGRGRLGFLNTALYAIDRNPIQYARDFHDILVGTNAFDSPVGFAAGPGYDLASGLGTPDVANLVRDLATSPFAGSPLLALPALFAGNGSGHGVHPGVTHRMFPG
jgi:subtilase family serine protease